MDDMKLSKENDRFCLTIIPPLQNKAPENSGALFLFSDF
jgi:hypothetical protein